MDSTREWMDNVETELNSKADSNDPRLNVDMSGYALLDHTHPPSPPPSPVYANLGASTAMALATNSMVQITPTANVTLTTTVPAAGNIRHIKVLTSGTSSRTITFGTGFKPTATLATGTVAARVFIVTFISDGTSLYEQSRTIAMVA